MSSDCLHTSKRLSLVCGTDQNRVEYTGRTNLEDADPLGCSERARGQCQGFHGIAAQDERGKARRGIRRGLELAHLDTVACNLNTIWKRVLHCEKYWIEVVRMTHLECCDGYQTTVLSVKDVWDMKKRLWIVCVRRLRNLKCDIRHLYYREASKGEEICMVHGFP